MPKRDWTLPGYKYLGPGNKLDKGDPNNHNDKVAQEHDYAYDAYLKKRKNPYTNWNDADEVFLKKARLNDMGGLLGSSFFQAKKAAYRIGAIGSLDEPSLSNSSREANMSLRGAVGDGDSAKGSGNNMGLKETPVDMPYDITRGPPDETFVTLPHMETGIYQFTDTYAADHAFRLNSPYDPHVNQSNVSLGILPNLTNNTPDGDPDGVTTPARWYNLYSSLYAYYSVVSTRYKVYIENLSSEPLWAHCMFYNETLPPPEATNHDILAWKGVRSKLLASPLMFWDNSGFKVTAGNAQTTINDGDDQMNEGDVSTALNSNYVASQGATSRGGNISCVFAGEYRPGQYKREIILDSQVENWTSVNTNPALPERLLIRIKPDNPGIPADATAAGDDIKFKLTVELDYLVEFKELSTYVRWPVTKQPVVYSISGGTAGAARATT